MGFRVERALDVPAAAALYDTDDEAAAQRLTSPLVRGHWFAYDDDEPVGVAVATVRPDDRVFVTDRVETERAFAPLLDAALRGVQGPIHVSVRDSQNERVELVRRAGMRHEHSAISYAVPFDRALAALPPPTRASRCRIVTVDHVDRDALYDLDTELRSDVPGNDGWRGNRAWFDDELASEECDPGGYRVAVDPESHALLGLCRMWRNPTGPALSLLGVARAHRSGYVAVELLRTTLDASSGWGWDSFATHTARPALQRRLTRLGATIDGGFHRFVRP